MKNQNELQLEKMLEVLRSFGLNSNLLEAAEKYLLEGDQELLSLFPELDLSKIKGEDQKASVSTFQALLKRNRFTEALRLFHIVYQIGGETISQVFPVRELRYNPENNEFVKMLEPYQAVTLYAQGVAYESYQLRRETVKKLLKLAGYKKNVLEEVLNKWQSEYINGKMLVYTAYFSLLKKEAAMKETKTLDGKGGILNSITGIFKKKVGSYAVTSEEGRHIKDFEDTILASIGNLLPVNESECKRIREYINADKEGKRPLQEKAAQLFKQHTMDSYLQQMINGCINIHYDLSYRLQSFMKLCAYGNIVDTLDAIYGFVKTENNDYFKGKIKDDLMLESIPYILWCGGKVIKEALYYEIEYNYEEYIKAVEQASLKVHAVLMDVLKEKKPEQYKRQVEDGARELQRKLIESILPEGNARSVVEEFLTGNGSVEILYPYANELGLQRSYYYSHTGASLEQYVKATGRDEFYKRCMAYMVFSESGYFFIRQLKQDEKGGYRMTETEELFKDWEDAGLDVLYQLKAAELIYDSTFTDKQKESFLSQAVNIFTTYMEKKEKEMLTAFESSSAVGRFMGICTFEKNADRYKSHLLQAFSDSSKLVMERLVEIMVKQEGWEADVLEKLKSKKSAERETALLILTSWKKDYTAVLEEALTTEKSKKLLDMIKNLLNIEESKENAGNISCEDLIKELHKGGRKKGILWAYETPFATVHTESGTEVTDEYMQAILLCYSSMNVPGVNKEVLPLTENLNKKELALYMNELYDKWMEKGAEAKKKWVLYASSIHGGSHIVQKLQAGINLWPQNARGAIAAEAVKALALNDNPSALLIVDSISRKFKFKQIKTAALEALNFAAEQLGLTTEELADKIVPDLGFNEDMYRIFDYGERRFFVYLTPALDMDIQDENQKKLKNLPAPGKRDDEAKAQAAFEEFKLLKKQMKTVVSNQKLRLDLALSVERKWEVTEWKNLFVKNPVMHQFAIGLIWGIYQEDKLKATFRYMEDGSFNTEDEEEYELVQEGKIGLVHPIELTKESIDKWEGQLKDYEVKQPLEQLNRKIFPLMEEEKGKKSLERFGGYILNPMSLSSKLLGMGWYRGSVQDAGGYYTFYREESSLSMGVELNFSGSFVGYEEEDVTVYEARFYEAGTIKRGSYIYDEVTAEKAIELNKVPARYFSEIVYQLEKATVSSQSKDENWRQK